MKKQIIAIGGGGFGRDPGKKIIEKYILEQSSAKRPNICFIPTATGDNDAYKVNFYSAFSQLNCSPKHLDFFKRTPDLEGLIGNQDIIYVGGGNTKSMLAVWKDWGLDVILRAAYDRGVIMCGVSAGAICWFKKGITDSWADKLHVMDCLGFVDGNCCPHYDEEKERRPTLHKFIKGGELSSCYAIDGGCALHLLNGQAQLAVVFDKNKNSYNVVKQNNEVVENPFTKKEIS
jgi:dipeptidase E